MLAQIYNNIEIIVCDGNSTDGTKEIIFELTYYDLNPFIFSLFQACYRINLIFHWLCLSIA
jgi:glycosyltransferase involved in cell wall biosynthesis